MEMATATGAMAPVEWQDAPRVVRAAFPARDRCERRDPRVPYALLEDAQLRAGVEYPDAYRIVALWTPNSRSHEVHVEVWDPTNRRARVLSADRIGEAIAWL